jgi:electron transport complex protein RnfE
LGTCPTLAVTNSALNALVMGVATTFVLIFSSMFVSVLRKAIPKQVRLSTYIVIIATFVTVADMMLEALVPDIHRQLGAFVALIVVNCIILGRQEAFAAKEPVGRAVLDAVGTGAGYILTLLMMGTAREIIGSGSLLGVSLFGPSYEPWVVMVLPPGGFFMIGTLLLAKSWWERRAAARRAAAAPAGLRRVEESVAV